MRKFITATVMVLAAFGVGLTYNSGATGNHVQRSTTSTDGHVKVDHIDICTANLGDHWQAAWSAYNVQHGGTIVTPGNEYDAGGAAAWTALSPATQQKWEDAVDAAEQRECHPIVP